MKVTQVTIGRFSQFHLARQLEKHGLLKEIWTGYPKFKLRDEHDIEQSKIKTFPWLQAPYMMTQSILAKYLPKVKADFAWWAHESLDWHVSRTIKLPTILIGLSGSALRCGQKAKSVGGIYICHRGSSHIEFQNEILHEEHQRWGLSFKGVDQRTIDKELKEYEEANYIVVPSEFAKQTFLKKGVPEEKIKKIVYGARMDRFQPVGNPDPSKFRILWVGAVSVRKGFMDALRAFQNFKHPNKEFLVVGSIQDNLKGILKGEDLRNVSFVGQVPNKDLPRLYSESNVFLISSIEDGFGVVMGEALACGCPVIATTNTGSLDLFNDGDEGFIVPIRSSDTILERFNFLVENAARREQMSASALKRVAKLGGWDTYGDQYAKFINSIF